VRKKKGCGTGGTALRVERAGPAYSWIRGKRDTRRNHLAFLRLTKKKKHAQCGATEKSGRSRRKSTWPLVGLLERGGKGKEAHILGCDGNKKGKEEERGFKR